MSEPDNGQNQQTDPNGAPVDPGHRNVSGADFDEFKNEVMGMLREFTSNSNPAPAPAPAATKPTQPAPSQPTGADAQLKSENERLANELSQMKAEQTHTKLVSVQTQAAKEAGIDLGDMADQLLGKDEETTKANVENMAKIMQANGKGNVKPTDNGFNIQKNGGKNANPDTFMEGFMKRQFGDKNK
ncbi:capsid assembly scaffolding protein Gp46 family protein [Lactiplantibacillus paraxiangfangensis]|uniref:capsid assembly scaffolding protein Gp46 family protein n=1 Tax=Lactiplantibacillus paraxiangfangensis TaxID=3076224 RepID=UPI0030C76E1D